MKGLNRSGAALGMLCAASVALSLPEARAEMWERSPRRFYVGVGALANNLGKYSTEATGETSLVSSVYAELDFMARFALGEGWGISPRFALTPFSHGSEDGGQSTRVYTLSVRGTRELGPYIDVLAGIGILNYVVSGSGGTVQLSNGTTTNTYARPDGSATSNLFFWEAGFGVQAGILRWDSSLMLTGAFSSRRAVSVFTQLSAGVF